MASRGRKGEGRRPGRRSFPFFLRNGHRNRGLSSSGAVPSGERCRRPADLATEGRCSEATRTPQSTLLDFFSRQSRDQQRQGNHAPRRSAGEESRENATETCDGAPCSAAAQCADSGRPGTRVSCRSSTWRLVSASQEVVEVIEVSSHDEESVAALPADAQCREATHRSLEHVEACQLGRRHMKRTRGWSLHESEGASTDMRRIDEGDRTRRGLSSAGSRREGGHSSTFFAPPGSDDCRPVPAASQVVPSDMCGRREPVKSDVSAGVEDSGMGASPGDRKRLTLSRPTLSSDGGSVSATCLVAEKSLSPARSLPAVDNHTPGARGYAEGEEQPSEPFSEASGAAPPCGSGRLDGRDDPATEGVQRSADRSASLHALECTCSTPSSERTPVDEDASGRCPPWMWNYTAPVYACLEASCTFNSHLFSRSEKGDLRRLVRLLALPIDVPDEETGEPRGVGETSPTGRDAEVEACETVGSWKRTPCQALSPGARLLFCRLVLQFCRTPRREVDFHSFGLNDVETRVSAAQAHAADAAPSSSRRSASLLASPWLRLAPLLSRSRREVTDPQAALDELRTCGLFTVWDPRSGVHTPDDGAWLRSSGGLPAPSGGAATPGAESAQVRSDLRRLRCRPDLPLPEQGDRLDRKGGDPQPAGDITSPRVPSTRRTSTGSSGESHTSSSPGSSPDTNGSEGVTCIGGKPASFSWAPPEFRVHSTQCSPLTSSGACPPEPRSAASVSAASQGSTCSKTQGVSRWSAQRRAAAATLKNSLIAAFDCLTVPELQRIVAEVDATLAIPSRASPFSRRFGSLACSTLAAQLRRLFPASRRMPRAQGDQRHTRVFKRRSDCLAFLGVAAEAAFVSLLREQGDDSCVDFSTWAPCLPQLVRTGKQAEQPGVKMKKLTHFFKAAASSETLQSRSRVSTAQSARSGDTRVATRSVCPRDAASSRTSNATRDGEFTSAAAVASDPASSVHTPQCGGATGASLASGPSQNAAASGAFWSLSDGERFLQMLREVLVHCVGPLVSFHDAKVLHTLCVAFFAFHAVHSSFLNFLSRSAPPAAVLWTSRSRSGLLPLTFDAETPSRDQRQPGEVQGNEGLRNEAEETVFSLAAAAISPAVSRLAGLVTYHLQAQRTGGHPTFVRERGNATSNHERRTDGGGGLTKGRTSVDEQDSGDGQWDGGLDEEGSGDDKGGSRIAARTVTSQQPGAPPSRREAERLSSTEGDAVLARRKDEDGVERAVSSELHLWGRVGEKRICETCGGAAARKPRQLEAPPLRCRCSCCEYARAHTPIFASRVSLFVYAAALLEEWRLSALLWGGLVLPAPERLGDSRETAVLAIVQNAAEKLRAHVEQAEDLLIRHLSRGGRLDSVASNAEGGVEEGGKVCAVAEDVEAVSCSFSESPFSPSGLMESTAEMPNFCGSRLGEGGGSLAAAELQLGADVPTGGGDASSPRLRRALEVATPPSKLFRFTPQFVWAKTISHGLELVEQRKCHRQAVDLLRLLLRLHRLRQSLTHCLTFDRAPSAARRRRTASETRGGDSEETPGDTEETHRGAEKMDRNRKGTLLPPADSPQLSTGSAKSRHVGRENVRLQPAVCRALSRHAGQWYNRLMVLLKVHLSRPLESLVVAVECLREPEGAVSLAERLAIGKRATALAKTLAHAAEKARKQRKGQKDQRGEGRRQTRPTDATQSRPRLAQRGRREQKVEVKDDDVVESDAETQKTEKTEETEEVGKRRETGEPVPDCWVDVLRLVGFPGETASEAVSVSVCGVAKPFQKRDSASVLSGTDATPQQSVSQSLPSPPVRSKGTADPRASPEDKREDSKTLTCVSGETNVQERPTGYAASLGWPLGWSVGGASSPLVERAAEDASRVSGWGESARLSWTRFFPRDVHARLLETEELQSLIEKDLPHSVVYARPLQASQQTGKSSVFVGWDNRLLSVEELCMQHYSMAGDWRAVHDEGRCLRMLFRVMTFDLDASVEQTGDRGSAEKEADAEKRGGPANGCGEEEGAEEATAEISEDEAGAEKAEDVSEKETDLSGETQRTQNSANRENASLPEASRSRETKEEERNEEARGASEVSRHGLPLREEAKNKREGEMRCPRCVSDDAAEKAVTDNEERGDGNFGEEKGEDGQPFVEIVFLPLSEPTAPSSIDGGEAAGEGEKSFAEPTSGGFERRPGESAERIGREEERIVGREAEEISSPFSCRPGDAMSREAKMQKFLEQLSKASRLQVAEAVRRTVRRMYGMRLPGLSWRGVWQGREEDGEEERAEEKEGDAKGGEEKTEAEKGAKAEEAEEEDEEPEGGGSNEDVREAAHLSAVRSDVADEQAQVLAGDAEIQESLPKTPWHEAVNSQSERREGQKENSNPEAHPEESCDPTEKKAKSARTPGEAPVRAREKERDQKKTEEKNVDERDTRIKQRESAKEACAGFFSMLAYGVGGRGLSEAFRLFSEDFSYWGGGLPDLLLWRNSDAKSRTRPSAAIPPCEDKREELEPLERSSDSRNGGEMDPEILFAEVKGPRDRLSEKQRYWLAHLLRAGVPCEMCKVLPPALASESSWGAPSSAVSCGENALSLSAQEARGTGEDGGPVPRERRHGEAPEQEASVSTFSDEDEDEDWERKQEVPGCPGAGLRRRKRSRENREEAAENSQRQEDKEKGRKQEPGETLFPVEKEATETKRMAACETRRTGVDAQRRQSKCGGRKLASSQVREAQLSKFSESDVETARANDVKKDQKRQRTGLSRVRLRVEWEEHDADKVEALCRRTRKSL
ncbi:VRR-NUC domain-containing protein [Toxoplasma gondii p89]|uniref:Fanconi-associated nuclease n=1 Tax=Toxoplasma gondii p89 TaxID=943119 RepID=A0A086KV12_TOXGO|nr:VRR-NUC domain-containing protein [Toxoplasma gondii p89]